MKFKKDIQGIAAVEMALAIPIFIAFLLAIIEFGTYFTKQQIASRGMTNISNTLQHNPAASGLMNEAYMSGLGIVKYDTPNFFCAKSYSTREEAESYCAKGEWQTEPPAGHSAGTPYYVSLKIYIDYTPLSPLSEYMNDIEVKNVVQISPAASAQKGMVVLKGQPSTNAQAAPAVSGTWNVPPGVNNIKVTIVNAGNAGNPRATSTSGGPGGDSGSTLIAFLTLKPGVTSIPYTIGAGGTASSNNTTNSAMLGGATSFGGMYVNQAVGTTPTFGTIYTTYSDSPITNYLAFPGNVGGPYASNYKTNGDDQIWVYVGGDGADTAFGLGSGGKAGFGAGYDTGAYNGNGLGAGGAGRSYHSTKAGNGAGGGIIIEW